MTCTEAEPLFSDLFDGELSDDARAAVEAHIAECADCAPSYRALRRTVRFVQGNGSTGITPGTASGAYANFIRGITDETSGARPLSFAAEYLELQQENEGERS